MTGNAVSAEADARARKNLALILQRLAAVGQEPVSKALSVSESTVSRWASTEAERCAAILALCGIKCVPDHVRCYEPKQIEAVLALAKARLAQIESAEALQWDE